MLLTRGTDSPPWFAPITGRLMEALPQADTFTFEGAGHIPHVTHPEAYARAVTAFVDGAGPDPGAEAGAGAGFGAGRARESPRP
ncbi:alpha/beta fold hydrolase [Streptomyces bottropensis]|uniref:alpha/beta fold hydrolase n=1 Tax=Streptomyces bottropensis TaxID=42235 RepID=UPI0036A6DDC0